MFKKIIIRNNLLAYIIECVSNFMTYKETNAAIVHRPEKINQQ